MDQVHENIAGGIGSVPGCQTCGSERVVKDAFACFNPDSGLWELESVLDQAHCQVCDEKTKLDWTPANAVQSKRGGRCREYSIRSCFTKLIN